MMLLQFQGPLLTCFTADFLTCHSVAAEAGVTSYIKDGSVPFKGSFSGLS